MAIRIRIISFILIFTRLTVSAQVDTEFWFAAPEVTSTHSDQPIYLRISSLQKPSYISITQPANNSFVPITEFVGANSTISIDLTNQITQIENEEPTKILNFGLLIEATNPITAYYEVLGSGIYSAYAVNSDIFVLKGTHALGTEFYTPFQTHWNNSAATEGYSSFDIVATEDNTIVTITPSQDIVGHLAGITYSITLNKGQTNSAKATSQLANLHPAGSHVTSSKPIAVTVKDDSIEDGYNYDLAGDQIIPVTSIGKEYIAIKISDTTNTDRLYCLATKPATAIYMDGNPIPIATINAGQTFEYQLLNPTAYITASDSIYVWHIAGFGRELGGAILPPIGCTGSRQVSFTRSTEEDFAIELLVKTGYEKYFKLNGSKTLVTAALFAPVLGSMGVWQYAKIPFGADVITSNSANLIKNDSSDFHLATINGGFDTGFRYGYFSDFGFLELGREKKICEGDSLVLDAGFLRDSYLWNTGGTQQYITVKDSGFYNVTITKGVCTSSDTVHIAYHPAILTDVLGNDTTACANEGLQLKTLYPFSTYKWNDGSITRSTRPLVSGNYSILVKNKYGCKKRDTMKVEIYPIPKPNILFNSNTEEFCKNPFVQLSANKSFTKYLWSTGDTTQSIVTQHNEKDSYSLLVSDGNNCKNSTSIEIDCSTVIGLVPNLLTPNNDGLNDVFYIEYLRPNSWTFEIYNGWGDRIYQNTAYDNSFNGKVLDNGVYYFSLRHNEGKGERKGWLQILR